MAEISIQPVWRSVVPRFAVNLLVLLLAVLAVAVPLYLAFEQNREEVLRTRAHGYVDVADQLVRKEFFEAVGDLRTLAAVPLVDDFLSDGSALHREALEHYFVRVAKVYRRHDQFRVLGLDGMELIRVQNHDGVATVASADRMQSKADRAYFKEAMALGMDGVHVSPLDLNMEGDVVEVPYKPTIRLAMPVHNQAGERKGVLVLNYVATGLLDSFRRIMDGAGQQGMLLNREGYWLSSADRRQEWGFMLGRKDQTFGGLYPQEWQEITARESGYMHTPRGLFVFRTIYPLDDPQASSRGAVITDAAKPIDATWPGYRWTTVVLVPEAQFQAASIFRRPFGQGLMLVVFTGLAVVSYMMAYHYVRARNSRRREQLAMDEIRDLYENAPCGYQSLDAEGRIVRINHTALAWLGYQRDELVDKVRLPQLLTDASQELFQSSFDKLKASGSASDMQLDMVRKDGSLLPASVNSTVVKDRGGHFMLSRSTVFDMTDRRKLERELERQAHTDVLTGACNRRHFAELGAREVSRAQRNKRPLSLIMLDVDHFKRVNDTHGHDAGDLVLKALTLTLVPALRDADVLARLGGEEFAALLPDTDLAQAQGVAERVRHALSELRVPLPSGVTLQFTVSIGVTQYNASMNGLDGMLKLADEAMYRAKNGGRNRVELAA